MQQEEQAKVSDKIPPPPSALRVTMEKYALEGMSIDGDEDMKINGDEEAWKRVNAEEATAAAARISRQSSDLYARSTSSNHHEVVVADELEVMAEAPAVTVRKTPNRATRKSTHFPQQSNVL